MTANPQTEFSGGHPPVGHLTELLAELLGRHGDVLIGFTELLGGVETAEIHVAGSVTEPPAHLQQGVVHARGAQIVADGQPLQGQAP